VGGGGGGLQGRFGGGAEPLCRVAVRRDRRRGFRRAADFTAHHAWRSRLWLGTARIPLLHLAFIGFAVAIIALAVALLLDEQFRDDGKPQPRSAFARAAVWLVIALPVLNVVSTLMECGFGACPDNPVAYELLKRAP